MPCTLVHLLHLRTSAVKSPPSIRYPYALCVVDGSHHALLLLSPPRPVKTSETRTLPNFPEKPLPLLLVLDVGDETLVSLP